MKRIPLFFLAATLLALPGCGGPGEVTGVVKYKGEALTTGTVTFYGETTGAWSSEIDQDGKYTIRGVPPGKVRIAVVMPLAITVPGMPPPPKAIAIPPRYNDAQKSGLTYEVYSGAQTKHLDLD
jgi:hypothetical protein